MVQFNTLMMVYLGLFLLSLLGRLLLTGLNIGHLRRFGDRVPAVFHGLIDGDTMTRMRNYTVDSSRLGHRECAQSSTGQVSARFVPEKPIMPRQPASN